MSLILSSERESFPESGKYANQDNLKIIGQIFITHIIWSLGIHARGTGVSFFGDTQNPSACFLAQPNVRNCLNKGWTGWSPEIPFSPYKQKKKYTNLLVHPILAIQYAQIHFSSSFLDLFSLVQYNCHENNPQLKFLLKKTTSQIITVNPVTSGLTIWSNTMHYCTSAKSPET